MDSNFAKICGNFFTVSLIAVVSTICLIPAVNAQQPEIRPKFVVSDQFKNGMAVIDQPESPYYKCLDAKNKNFELIAKN